MATTSKSFVILFGDSSLDTFDDTVISNFPNNRKTPLLDRLLRDVETALQREHARLPASERSLLPAKDIVNFLQRRDQEIKNTHPALAAVKLVLIQLASFIYYYEENPLDRYPQPSTDSIIGLCLGHLSAVAVTCAHNLHELVPLAVEAVCLAFRIGNLTHSIALELEGPDACSRSWSAVFLRDRELSDEKILEEHQEHLNIPLRNRAYISASTRKNVTISGPPSTFQILFHRYESSVGKSKPYQLPIYSPYHAPHLYSADTVKRILRASEHRDLKSIYLHNIKSFEQATQGILLTVLDWDSIVEDCKDFMISSNVKNWSVRAFGPTSSPKSLLSSIGLLDGIKLSIDDEFGVRHSSAKSGKKPPLAIVGMAGRFPQASNLDELWKLLMERIDCHSPIPESRFNPSTHLSQNAYGCFIDSPGSFDAKFFNMSPREALQTDPGQRLALVTAYEALEMSGYVPNRTPSTRLDRIGAFYGQTVDEYKEQNMPQNIDTYFIPGSLRAFGPGRINRYFKFGGPASSLDTACSSSAVALNTACNSVWDEECTMAVVGGINILAGSDNYNGLIAGHFLSPTGGCKTFDDSADGYCRAEAVASIVIKRLDDAEADNDNILGVVLSAATNYSAGSVSITRPYIPAQKRLYNQVLHEAGLHASDIGYVEMHGTGTQAGDGCEIRSVADIFAPVDSKKRGHSPLYISAVKPNLGHSEAASGITSLIKALLALREQKLPPHIGIRSSINKDFPDLEGRNIIIPTKETDLPQHVSAESRFRVLVNNFGAAGGNTAVVIEAPTKARTQRLRLDRRPKHIINITANSKYSLGKNIANIIQFLDRSADISLTDLSYTTTARRIHHPLRVSTVASSINDLKRSLGGLQQDEKMLPDAPKKVSKIVFAFTGQGSAYCSLSKELFQTCPLFKSYVMRLEEIGNSHGFRSFLGVIDGSTTDISILTTTELQLAITAIQIALFQLWAAWGVEPEAVIGHSLGEYAALYASGVLTISDTIYLVGNRAELLETTCQPKTHAMLALKVDPKSAYLILEESGLEMACINGPSDFVLSGPRSHVQEVYDDLKSKGFKSTVLEIDYGFHSSQVDSILEPLEHIARGVTFRSPRIPVISPVLGRSVKEEQVFNSAYLPKHAREPVNFYGALETAQDDGVIDGNAIWLEIGPHPLCSGMVKATLGMDTMTMASLKKGEHSCDSIANATSTLFSYGVEINWEEYHRAFDVDQRLLILPNYAWEEKEYWMPYENNWILNKGPREETEADASKARESVRRGPNTTSVQKLLNEEMRDGKLHLLFESDLDDPDLHGAILGHLVNGAGLCPASIYADMALTAANYVLETHEISSQTSGVDVANMNIFRPIVVSKNREEVSERLHLSLVADLKAGEIRCRFGGYQPHSGKTDWKADCMVTYTNATLWKKSWDRLTYLIQGRIASLEAGVLEATTHKLFQPMVYRLFTSCVDYDIKYQAMKEVLMKSTELEASAKLSLYSGSEGGRFFCSPFWIDALVHLAGFVMNANETTDNRNTVWISGGWGSMQFANSISASFIYTVYVKMTHEGEDTVLGDVYVIQDDAIVAKIGDLNFHRLPRVMLDKLFRVALTTATQNSERAKGVVASNTTKPQSWAPHPQRPETEVISEALDSQSDRILQYVAEEVGVSLAELLENDDFEKMGVDSLMSLQILSKISTTLNIDLDSDIFQSCKTVQELRTHLHKLYSEDSDNEVDSSFSGCASPSSPMTPCDNDENDASNDNRLAELLVSTISEELGVDANELQRHAEDLTALGLDSLMGFVIISSLEHKFGIEIESPKLPEKVTLSSLKSLVGKASSGSQTPLTNKGGIEHERKIHDVPLSIIIRGNPASASKIAFLFPDGSGSAGVYQGIHVTWSDICLIGLNSPFLKRPEQYDCTIDDIVRAWVAEIRIRQKNGPYNLIGYSAGAYYAFEAAKQLMGEGETVSRLILIDSPCRTRYGAMPASVLDYLNHEKKLTMEPESDGKSLSTTSTTNQDLIRRHFMATIARVQEYAPKPLLNGPPTTLIWASSGIAKENKSGPKPESSSKEVDLFTKWLFHRESGNHDCDGWEVLLRDSPIDIKVVPGNHFSIIHPRNTESLSRIIEDSLVK